MHKQNMGIVNYYLLLAFHGNDGYMVLTNSTLTPMADIYREAAEEIGYQTVDVNGKDQIGESRPVHWRIHFAV